MIMYITSPPQREYLLKAALIFLFLLISVALLITRNTPAIGYESSIYWETPLIFWISVISAVIVGITIIVLWNSDSGFGRAYLWKIGLLLVFLGYTLTLSLLLIRGYYMWGIGIDPASHIGWIKETLISGNLPQTLIYPILHIYISEIFQITNLSLVFLHKLIPLVFGMLCILFIYVMVRSISSDRVAAIFAVVIGCTINYGWYLNLTPNGLANLFLPLAIFLTIKFLKQKILAWGILLTIVIMLYPEFHPVPALFLGILFVSLWIPSKLQDFWEAIRENKIELLKITRRDLPLIVPLLLLSIWFAFWVSSFSLWGYSVNSIYQTVSAEGGPSKISVLADQISYAQGYGYSVVEQILKQMGGSAVLLIISAISFPLIWKIYAEDREEKYIFSLFGPFGVLCLFIPVLYLFDLAFGPLRLVIYATILGTVFAAYILARIIRKNKKETDHPKFWAVPVFTILLLSGLFTLGILNLYPSPYNLTPSYQTTQSEVSGMNYFFDYHDPKIPVSGITAELNRFSDAFLTPEEKNVQDIMSLYNSNSKAPWHFGYDTSPSLGLSYNKETYLIITQRDKDIYKDYFPDMAKIRYTDRDFEQLKDDTVIDLLYTNGEFELWNIAG